MGGVITELKKLSVVVLSTPSAAPVLLLKVRTLPLMTTRNCVGPTAPIESGGKPLASARVAAVKLKPTVCDSSEMGEAGGAGFPANGPLGSRRAGGVESWSGRGVCLAARSLGLRTLACVTGASCFSRAMSWAVLARTPISPVHGVPTASGSITAWAAAGEPRIRLQPCANRPIHRRGDFIHQARCRAGRNEHRVRTNLRTASGGEGSTAAA